MPTTFWKGVVGDERIWWSRDLHPQLVTRTDYLTADTPGVATMSYVRI